MYRFRYIDVKNGKLLSLPFVLKTVYHATPLMGKHNHRKAQSAQASLPLRKQSKRLSPLRSIAKHFVAFLMRKGSREKRKARKRLCTEIGTQKHTLSQKRYTKLPPCTENGAQKTTVYRFRYAKSAFYAPFSVH